MKLLLGEALQRATGQIGLSSARAHEGKTPIGEAHGRPPDLLGPQRQGSIVREPMVAVPKARVHAHQARRAVLDEGARRALIRGPTWASSSSIRTPVSGQHYSSRGRKT